MPDRERSVRVRNLAGNFPTDGMYETNLRILVIDDDESALANINAVLTRARYNVALAASGEDGIAQLLYKQFDLVVCNVSMSGNPFMVRI